MTRLPNPGGDQNQWGDILNSYLLVSHTADGTLKPNAVSAGHIRNDAVTVGKLSAEVRDQLNATGSGGATNLSASTTATDVTVASDTGTDATVAAATTTNAGVLSAADKVKLNSVNANATANATDAQLRDRGTHTGSQPISSVSGLQAVLDDKADSDDLAAKANSSDLATVATSGAYGDLSGRPTIAAQFNPIAGANVTLSGSYPNITISSAGEGEAIAANLDTTATATAVTVTNTAGTDATITAATTTAAGAMTAADKTKLNSVNTGATANASDAQLRDRAAHTGTQAISTVAGLQTALNDKADTDAVVTSANSTMSGIEYYASESALPSTGVAGVLYITPVGN